MEEVSNSDIINGWRSRGDESMLGRKPFLACLIAEVMVMMQSGVARWHGKRRSIPPRFVSKWQMRLVG